jgi:chemotaxis protein CheD
MTATTRSPYRFVHAGMCVVARQPDDLMTILGSCVAVCLWDPVLKLGGMNHFVLPEGGAGSPKPARFGDRAVVLLVEAMEGEGSNRRRLAAKVFGGARISSSGESKAHLGRRNADSALAQLAELGVALAAKDVSGTFARKIVFSLADGSVLVRRL